METVVDHTNKEKKPPCKDQGGLHRNAYKMQLWMPVRKSDLLRAGCASKPRLHRKEKLKTPPLLYPEFVPCMMLNQEEEKQEVVLAALRGDRRHCPIGQADQTGIQLAGYDSAT